MCEYCWARYRVAFTSHETVAIQVCEAPIIPLRVNTVLDRGLIRVVGQEAASKMAINHLKGQLADTLAEALTLETHEDLCKDQVVISGTIRVVPPDYRFR